MLVIVSTPSAPCSQYSCSLHHQHFVRLQGPQTGLGNPLITQGMSAITSIYWIHLSKILSGMLYFPVMLLLYVGSAVVSAVVSPFSFSVTISVLQFEWLNFWRVSLQVYFAHMKPWFYVPLSQSQTSWYVQSMARRVSVPINLREDCRILSFSTVQLPLGSCHWSFAPKARRKCGDADGNLNWPISNTNFVSFPALV